MNYDDLLDEVDNNGIELYENDKIGKLSGLCVDNIITINTNITTNTERKCILAEELGHYHTTAGDILDQSKTENRKQEHRARRWAVRRLVKVQDFIKAFESGVTSKAELAEFLDLTESFLHVTIDHFKRIYGQYCEVDDYVISFDPLYVYKRLEGDDNK